MIAVLRADLHRTLTVRSAWLSVIALVCAGLLLSLLSRDMWALLIGMGTFALAVTGTTQHFQHRTAVLLYLGRPRRLTVLAGQTASAALLGAMIAATSGVPLLGSADTRTYVFVVLAVPVMAVFGVACGTVVRRGNWLLLGATGWLLFIEGLVGKLARPLPFSSFLNSINGDRTHLLIFAGWTVAALLAAIVAARRDLTGD